MSALAQLTPPAPWSVQVGIRALIRTSHRHLLGVAAAATCRQLHTTGLTRQQWRAESTGPLRPQWFSPSSRSAPTSLPVFAASYPLPRTQVRTFFRRFRPIDHYNKIPLDYADAKGLPFRKEDLNQTEVDQIFGSHLKAESANQLLRIIHGRRVAGSLADPALQINTAHYSTQDKVTALMYLRKHVPVDEIVMAGLRAEDELKVLDGNKWDSGIHEEAEHQHEETSPQTQPTGRLPRMFKTSDSPYGEGAFDRMRKANIAKREAEEKRLEEERKKREEEEALQNIGPLSTEQVKPRELSPWMQKHVERATSNLKEPPKATSWQRLSPFWATAIFITSATTLIGIFYTEPTKEWRLFPDIPTSVATCSTLIALNVAVWALWKYPPAWRILNRHFLAVAAVPGKWQVLGAMFSHQSIGHLALNMVVLWFFGTRLHDEVGRAHFLSLYLSCGALGFAATMTDFVLRRGLRFTTHGASGAVYGVLAAYFWRHKFDEFKVVGLPPDPMSGPNGLAFLGFIVGLHIAGVLSKNHRGIDLVSHLAGMAAGIVGSMIVQANIEAIAHERAEMARLARQLEDAEKMTGLKRKRSFKDFGKRQENESEGKENENEGKE